MKRILTGILIVLLLWTGIPAPLQAATVLPLPAEIVGQEEGIGSVSPEQIAKLKLPFIPNRGQIEDAQVQFYAQTFAGTVFVTGEGLTYALPGGEDQEGWAIKESLVGGRGLSMTAGEETPTRVNYYLGDEKTGYQENLPVYESIGMAGVYDRVGLELKAYGNNIEKIFTVYPGGDPEQIRLQISGAQGISVNEQGELELTTELGAVAMTAPVAYQISSGQKKNIAVEYTVEDNTYGFQLGQYDKSLPLVIDPLLAATYLGGTLAETAYALALDSDSNVYVAGATKSTDFPALPGGYSQEYSGGTYDVFVAKLNPELSQLLAATYIGGNNTDTMYGNSIALKEEGGNVSVYLAGTTQSTDFPSNVSNPKGSGQDFFVAHLDGSDLSGVHFTQYGGTGADSAYAIGIDPSGDIIVAGQTTSTGLVLPGYEPVYQSARRGTSADVVIAKFDSGLTVQKATYLGGNAVDTLSDMVIGTDGEIYLAGVTRRASSGFQYPVTDGAYKISNSKGTGVLEGYISVLSNDLKDLIASTYLGGTTGNTEINAIALNSGNVYVTGTTQETDFPVREGAYQTAYKTSVSGSSTTREVFISKLSADLTQLLASTYLGGKMDDYGVDIAVDSSGSIYVSGYTNSFDFPPLGGNDTGDDQNSFVSKFNADLGILQDYAFVGGEANSDGSPIRDTISAMARDVVGHIYVTGTAVSESLPAESGYQKDKNGSANDAFVTKLNLPGNTTKDDLISIIVSRAADKRVYTVGEALDTTGLQVTGTYGDGEMAVLMVNNGNVSGFDSSSARDGQVLTITLDGRTTHYTVDIKPASAPLASIAITQPAAKLSYNMGEPLDLHGLEVTGTYEGGATQVLPITAGNISGFDSTVPQAFQTLTVTVDGKTANYDIEIQRVPASVLSLPDMMVGQMAIAVNNKTGTAAYSGDNGPALVAGLRSIGGTVFDRQGNLYIVDSSDRRIREVAAMTGPQYGQEMQAGYIYTIAGTGTNAYSAEGIAAAGATFRNPADIAVDSFGNLCIAEDGRVRVIANADGIYYGISMQAGNIYTIAGLAGTSVSSGYAGDGGLATDAQLNPSQIDFDSLGNLFITESSNYCIRVVAAVTGRFYGLDLVAGNIYTVAGRGTSSGAWGEGIPATDSRLGWPKDIAFDDSGNLYIADAGTGSIRVVDSNGIITTLVDTPANLASLGIDSEGNLYAGASGRLYNAEGSTLTEVLLTAIERDTPVLSQSVGAAGITFDPYGNIYSTLNNRVIYAQLSETLTLSALTVSATGDLPVYLGTPVNFDLSTLILSGTDREGAVYDLTGLPVTWNVDSGQAVIATGSTLTLTGSGQVYVTATINGVTSAPFLVADSPVEQEPLTVVSAATDVIGKNIVLEFDKPVEDASALAGQFLAKVDGVDTTITAVRAGEEPEQIVLTLGQWVSNRSPATQEIKLSYTADTKGVIHTADGSVLPNFTDKPVTNKIIKVLGTGEGALVDFAPAANEVSYDPVNKSMKYRFVDPVDYDDVHLILYMSNGFFDTFAENLSGNTALGIDKKVRLVEKDTGVEVALPNVGTVPHLNGSIQDGWLRMTDWYFEQTGNHAPLGLELISRALKPSTTYEIRVDKGFKFRNSSQTSIAYTFEFTTTAESLTKPYWNAGAALSYDLGTMQQGAALALPFGLAPVTTGSAFSYDPAPVTTGSALSFGLMSAPPGAALTLSWPEAQDNHGTAYNNLRYNIYQNGQLLAAVGGTETTYEVSGLSPGTSYYFSVEAEDFAGNKSEVNLTAMVTTPPDETQQPAPGLTPDSGDKLPGQAVDIRFTDNAAWRQAVTHVLLDGVSLTSAQYTLSPGVLHIREGVIDSSGSHSIVIKAAGYVDTSATQVIAGSGGGTPGGGADILPPTWPVGASLTGDKDKQVNANLKWTAARDNVGVTEYRIYLAGEDTPIKVVAGTVTSAYITDIGSGQVTVLVKAVDAAGNESAALSCIVGGQNVGSFTVTITALNTDSNNAVIQFDFTAGFMSPDNIANRLNDAHYLANLSKIKLYKKDTTTPIAYATENYHHYGDSSVSADKRLRRLTLTYRGLEKDAVYVVEAGAGITANNGSTLGMDYTYEFTAGETPAVVPGNPPANQGTTTKAPDNTDANKKILENLANVTEEQREAARLTAGHAEAGIAKTSQQTLQTNDGIRMVIPPGALQGLTGLGEEAESVRFKVEIGSVTEVPKAESASLMLDPVKFQREFSIEGLNEGAAQFNVPITVSFPVVSADLPSGTQFEQLAIYWWNPDKKDWVKLGGVYDAAAGMISVTTYHFSTYAVMADPVDRPLRLAGSTRFDTANRVADYGWKGGADQAVLVNAYAYADALAAVPLAYKLNAPILFTEKDRITPETLAQLQTLGVQKVVLAGGTGVISEAAEAELAGLYGEANVTRYGGQERYETAALLAEALGSTGQAIIVNTELGRYTDTLSISGYAGYYGSPILFTRSDGLPEATAKALDDRKVSRTIIIGGTGVIPQAQADRLPEVTRYGGEDAYETSVLVAEGLGLNTSQVYTVTSLNFADALVAGNLSARTLSPIILVDKEIPRPTADFLLNHKGKISSLIMVGSESAVSSIQESAMRSAILSGAGSGAGDGAGDGSGANSRPAEMFDDFAPEATVLKDSEDRIEYRYNTLIPYNQVELVWYFSFGFFSTFESNLKNYVKFYEKETKAVVDLPNLVTVPITSEGHMEITDWWFDRIGGHAPLGLTLKSRELKPDTTYVIEILAGFTFNNGNKTSKTYSFEFTTTSN